MERENERQNIKIMGMAKDIEFIKKGQEKLEKSNEKLWSRFDTFGQEIKEIGEGVKKSAIAYADNSIQSHIRDYNERLCQTLDEKYAEKKRVDELLDKEKLATDESLKILKHIKYSFFAILIMILILAIVKSEYVEAIFKAIF